MPLITEEKALLYSDAMSRGHIPANAIEVQQEVQP